MQPKGGRALSPDVYTCTSMAIPRVLPSTTRQTSCLNSSYTSKGVRRMSAELDSLIRKSKDLETQIEQLTAELSRLRAAIAEHMGDRREYHGHGVVAKKWAHVRWEVDKALLLDELSAEAL